MNLLTLRTIARPRQKLFGQHKDSQMKLTVQNIQKIMGYLRNVAEVDANDQIANAASSLAYRLEAAGTSVFDMGDDFSLWSEVDRAAAQYAIRKKDQYVLLPGQRHAVDLKRVERQRRTQKKK
jgi:hypothetical protein